MGKQDELDKALMEEMENIQLDDAQDHQDESSMNQQEYQDSMMPEELMQHNQHTFLSGSLDQQNPEKVTFLSTSELGVPVFSMRFLQDIEDISKHYLDDLCLRHGVDNKISEYFRAKIKNVADSGMSNQGFIQNLNVTKKVDMTRTRKRNLDNLKGGKQNE